VLLQVVLVMTDGDYEPSEDPTVPLNIMLNDLQVNIFSMGLGSWLKTGSVRAMTSKPYYYGTIAQWIDLVGSVTSPVQYVPSSVSSSKYMSERWNVSLMFVSSSADDIGPYKPNIINTFGQRRTISFN